MDTNEIVRNTIIWDLEDSIKKKDSEIEILQDQVAGLRFEKQYLDDIIESYKAQVKYLKESKSMRTPLTARPLYNEYLTIGYILRYEKIYYDMTRDEFVNCCMFHSHGSMSPYRAAEIYEQLMKDAGLEPL
jgi:hypothetical protein